MNLLFNDKERCTAAVATLTLKFGFKFFQIKFLHNFNQTKTQQEKAHREIVARS